jgi:hypothetical protein
MKSIANLVLEKGLEVYLDELYAAEDFKPGAYCRSS